MTDAIERFMSKVVKLPDGCWQWIGKIHHQNGYGRFCVKKRQFQAHRWLYENLRGSVPINLDLDHLCRRRDCVNPDHVEPVSRRENLLRGNTIPAKHAAKTHCPQGHPYDSENTYLYRGLRYCRICRDAHRLKHKLKSKRVRASDILFID
jgi:hypothetical protein